jgi:exonuclease III
MFKNEIFSFFSLLSILFVFTSCVENKQVNQQELKVLQLNIWQQGTMVPDGLAGIAGIIAQTSPDVVFLCEIRNYNDEKFIPGLLAALNERGFDYYGESLDMSVGILSKYKIENPHSAFTLDDKSRPMLKGTITVNGQNVTLYSAHLDYTHYECYLPRGYSGTTWEKIDTPVTDVQSILDANRIAYRDEAIAAFIEDAHNEIVQGNIVIMGGDFNEPSHLDWQEDTKNLWDHNGVVIDWDCSVKLAEAGYKDSYREIHPDPVQYPGFTFPAANKDVDISKLTWAPEVDERDRIDFIYYYPVDGISLEDVKIVGPPESVYYGVIGSHDAKDEFIEPKSIWPTDHKGNLALFTIQLAKN